MKKSNSKPHAQKSSKKSQVKNTSGKKSTKRARTGNKSENSTRKNKRATDIRATDRVSKKAISNKGVSKRPLQVQKKPGPTSRTRIKSSPESGRSTNESNLRVAKQNSKTGKQLDFTFNKVRSIDRKISTFSGHSDKAIKKQLAKRGGKPPRGIVVVVTDSNGKEAAAVSPLTFVVNQQNVKDFTTKFLNELKEENKYYKENRQKIINKINSKKKRDKYADDYALIDTLDALAEENYGDYNPDNISSISIKFIY